MKSVDKSFYERLADARGNRVVFLSHCLLDENVRYQGGAFQSGAVPEGLALIRTGVGICQMPCPEQLAWGGVKKPRMLCAYGLIDTRLYRFRSVLFGLFLSSTRLRYRLLARRVAREIEEYRDAGSLSSALLASARHRRAESARRLIFGDRSKPSPHVRSRLTGR